MPISEITMYGKGNMQELKKILYVWFRINRENTSKHAFCFMKLNGLREESYFNEIALKDTKICLEVLFWSHERFVGFYFLDL